MDIKKRFRFIRRLLRFLRRRQQKLKARRHQKYRHLNSAKNVELWKEKDELVPADYTDYRWRAQNKYDETHRQPRGSGHGSYPGLAPGSTGSDRRRGPSDHTNTYGSKHTRESFRNQRQEETMHPGHHEQCACLVVKRYTQEMHLRAERERLARASHQRARHAGHGLPEPPSDHHRRPRPPHQPNDPFTDLAYNRHHDNHRRRPDSHRPDCNTPQATIPSLPANQWIRPTNKRNKSAKGKSKRQPERIPNETQVGDYLPNTRDYRLMAVGSQPYSDLSTQQQIEVDIHLPPSHHYPTPMPMPSSNPFLEGAKDTLETVGANVKRVSGHAVNKVKHGAEIASRQKHHFGQSYNKLGADDALIEYQNDSQLPYPLPVPNLNTNPFLDSSHTTVDSLARSMHMVRKRISDKVLESGEVVGRLGHHRPGEQSYDILPDDFSEDFIDSSEHSRLDSDTIDNLLDDLDESTLEELKELDQSSLCELQDMCLQLQTIVEENSGDEGDAENERRRMQQTTRRLSDDINRSTHQPVQQSQIPVAIVPPQTVTSSAETLTDYITKGAKRMGNKADNSASCVHEHGEHCACEAVRRYTDDMNRREYERMETRRLENESNNKIQQVYIPIDPNNEYIARANSIHETRPKSNSTSGVGTVVDKVIEGKEAAIRLGVHRKGKLQYQQLDGFTDEFSNLEINTPVENEGHIFSPQRDLAKRHSLPTPSQMESQQLTFVAPKYWVQFHDQYRPDIIGEGVSMFYQQLNDGVQRGKERIQRMKVHAKGSYSRLQSASSDEETSPVKVTHRRPERPVSEPTPAVFEDPATGVRIYKAIKKPKKASKSKKVNRSVSAPAGAEEMADNDRNHEFLSKRNSMDGRQDDTNAQSASEITPRPLTATVIKRPSSTPGNMSYLAHSPTETYQSSAPNHSSTSKMFTDTQGEKQGYDDFTGSNTYANITQFSRPNPESSNFVKCQHTRQLSEPINLVLPEVVGECESQARLQPPAPSSHVKPQQQYSMPSTSRLKEGQDQHAMEDASIQQKSITRQEKHAEIQKWVEAVTHETRSREDLDSMSRHNTRPSSKTQKKKSSKGKSSAGLRWVRYRSLVDLQEGEHEADKEWEDEMEMKKRKRKARRKKTLKRIRSGIKFLLDGMEKVNEEGVYYPKLYYSNRTPHHRPRF